MDRIILGFDRALRTLSGTATSAREVPGSGFPESLGPDDRRSVAALMRVNHSGEVCAQALYQAQALMARDPDIAVALQASADEEIEHLAWTLTRLQELGARKSLLDPVWYLGAFAVGAAAAAVGDRQSLAFLRETELQVVDHLERHLGLVPGCDGKTRALLEQMRDDEAKHAATAQSLGAPRLPRLARCLMRLASTVMTRTAARI